MKMTYHTPQVVVERYVVSNTAFAVCSSTLLDTTTEQTVYCVIGNQSETVFYTNCSGSSQAQIIENYGGETDYLIWFTYEGDMGNSSSAPNTDLLDDLCEYAGIEEGTTGYSGWHYAIIDTSSGYVYTNVNS